MTRQASATGLVKQAPDGGINFFDTAGVCSQGQSEAVLGAALKELGVDRESVVIAAGGRYTDVRADPDAALTPGVVVYRFNGRLFFADAHFFKRRVWAAVDGAPKPVRHLVLDGPEHLHPTVQDAVDRVREGQLP